MKLTIFTILLTLLAYSQQRRFTELTEIWHAHVLRHSDKCLLQTGADPKLALRVVRYGEFIDDYAVMCFLRCASENLFITYEDGSLNENNFLNILHIRDPKVVSQAKLIDECFKLESVDQCEKLYRIGNCTYRAVENVMKNYT